jgi:hypothetical protein
MYWIHPLIYNYIPPLAKITQKGICRSLTPRCEYENAKASLV